MPVSRSRSHVFEGRRDNRTRWYVVDPAAADPDADFAAWREKFAGTNSPFPRRLIAGALGWGTFLAIVVLVPALFSAFVTDQPGVIVLVSVGSFIGAVAAGVALHGLILPDHPVRGWGPNTVQVLENEVLEWADDTTPIDDLWALNTALRRVRNLQETFEYWGVDYHLEVAPRPDRVVETTIEPILRAKFEVERDRLVSIASRLGFLPPVEVLSDLDSSDAAEA